MTIIICKKTHETKQRQRKINRTRALRFQTKMTTKNKKNEKNKFTKENKDNERSTEREQ